MFNLRKSRKALLLLTAVGVTIGAATAFASSHREAPNITGSPRVDGTDLYAFQSYETGRTGYTTILANYNPSQNPGDGPNYYAFDPKAIYEINVDNNGDGIQDLTYRFQFTQTLAGGGGIALPVNGQNVAIPLKVGAPITAGTPAGTTGLNFIQTYTVNVTTGDRNTDGTRKVGMTTAVTNHADSTTTFTKPMDNIGTKTFPNGYANYAAPYVYTVDIPGCSVPGKVFVGQRKEGFSVNLNHVFDLVNVGTNKVPVNLNAEPEDTTHYPGATAGGNGGTNNANGIAKSTANNYLSTKNITTIALEVPTNCLTGETVPGTADAHHNGVVGIWTTASLPQAQLLDPNATFVQPTVNGGAYTQVSRLGMPLVNELVIGLKDKDHFNASKPINDAQFATYVTNPTLPALLASLFGVTAPTNFPRTDLETAFLTGITGVNTLATVTPSEMLRLNTTIAPVASGSQDHLGVLGDDLAGFPNGRRPGDEVVDVTLRVAMGKLCTLTGATFPAGPIPSTDPNCNAAHAPSGNLDYTDGAQIDQTQFLTAFPYLGTPISGD